MVYRITSALQDRIAHYASFQPTAGASWPPSSRTGFAKGVDVT